MDSSTFFITGLLTGILLIVEGYSLRRSEGRINSVATITSTLEFFWLLVCVYALFAIRLPGWTIIIPAAYVSYFIVAAWHFRSFGKDLEKPEDVKNLQLPYHITTIEIVFGAGLVIASGLALLQFSGATASA